MGVILTLREIPTAKVADALAGILREHPVPLIPDPDSTEETPLPYIPKYTGKVWAEKLAEDYLNRERKSGNIKLRTDAIIDIDMFE
ncbi:hypothetical protein LCGC14_0594280 [marine sediment metagenome]|uniref:Uncharacterized protein n=1 Tax=marine sediment metagenome TaxID=412755 RepID=A0A0F9TYN0_9ZZZZ